MDIDLPGLPPAHLGATALISFALGIIGITGQLVMLRKPTAGWGISIASQPLWYAFSIVTGGYGLLLTNTGFFIAAILNFRKARRGARNRAAQLASQLDQRELAELVEGLTAQLAQRTPEPTR